MAVYTIVTIKPELLEDEKRVDASGLTVLPHEIPGEVSSYKLNLGGITGTSFVLGEGENKKIVVFEQRKGISKGFIDEVLATDDTVAVSEDGSTTLSKSDFLQAVDTLPEKYFVKIGKDSHSLRGVLMLFSDYETLKTKDKNDVLEVVKTA